MNPEARLKAAEELIKHLLPCCFKANCEAAPTYMSYEKWPVVSYYCFSHMPKTSWNELPYAHLIRRWIALGGRFF
jgi:hypothetical protein